MKVMKFKSKDGEYLISFINERTDRVEITSKDEPLPELNKTLQGLDIYVKEICELPENANIKVTGVSFSRSMDDSDCEVLGVVIIAQLVLKKSTGVLNMVTPHRIEKYYSEFGDEGQLMPDGLYDYLIDEVIPKIEQYLKGKRAQGNLFEQDVA